MRAIFVSSAARLGGGGGLGSAGKLRVWVLLSLLAGRGASVMNVGESEKEEV